MENTIKIILSVLFFGCLLDMPYEYYQLIRFVAMLGFGILAYKSQERNEGVAAIIFIALAILFQPFFKITLGRELWNIVDVVVGIGLIASIFIKPKKS